MVGDVKLEENVGSELQNDPAPEYKSLLTSGRYAFDCLTCHRYLLPPVGSRVVRIDPLHFVAGCRKADLTKSVYLSLGIDFTLQAS